MEHTYWNPNVHYHPWLLEAAQEDGDRVLDIGSGDGTLVRALAERARHVTGLDSSGPMVELARHRSEGLDNVDFVQGDFFEAAATLPREQYDLITMVAVAHHLGTARALETASTLLAPGGRLAVIGLAVPHTAVDWLALPPSLLAISRQANKHGGKQAADGLPVTDPDLTWSQARRTAHHVLPGSRWRRRLLWRYSVLWEKPATQARAAAKSR